MTSKRSSGLIGVDELTPEGRSSGNTAEEEEAVKSEGEGGREVSSFYRKMMLLRNDREDIP